MKVLLHVLCVW